MAKMLLHPWRRTRQRHGRHPCAAVCGQDRGRRLFSRETPTFATQRKEKRLQPSQPHQRARSVPGALREAQPGSIPRPKPGCHLRALLLLLG